MRIGPTSVAVAVEVEGKHILAVEEGERFVPHLAVYAGNDRLVVAEAEAAAYDADEVGRRGAAAAAAVMRAAKDAEGVDLVAEFGGEGKEGEGFWGPGSTNDGHEFGSCSRR